MRTHSTGFFHTWPSLLRKFSIGIFAALCIFSTLSITPTSVSAEACDENCNKDADDSEYLQCISRKKECLEKELSVISDQKNTLNNTISLISGNIRVQEIQISQTTAEIRALEKEITELDQRIGGLNISLDRLTSLLVNRIRSQYKRNRVSPLALFTKADTFNSFLTQYKYIGHAGEQTAKAMSLAESQRLLYDDQKTLKEEKQTEFQAKTNQLQSQKTELDRQKLAEITKADVLLEILPVLDNFQLAAKHIPVEIENDNWVSGIKQIEKQLESILTSVGLEKIPTIGNQFDHNLHEAIESISSEKPESEIVEEIQSGYKLNSNVIRPAKVKVSAGSEKKK